MDVVSVVERSDDRRSSTTNVSGDKVTLNPLWSEKLRFSSGFPVASPTGDILRISTHILKDDSAKRGVQRNMVLQQYNGIKITFDNSMYNIIMKEITPFLYTSLYSYGCLDNFDQLQTALGPWMLTHENKKTWDTVTQEPVPLVTQEPVPLVTQEPVPLVMQEPVPLVMQEPVRRFSPRKPDSLFWSMFVAHYGVDTFFQIGNKYMNRELEEKTQIMEYVKTHKLELKSVKISVATGQEIMGDLMTNRTTTLLVIPVFSLYYEANIWLVSESSRTYIEFLSPNSEITYLVYRSQGNRGLVEYSTSSSTTESLQQIRENYIHLDSATKPIKGIGSFKVTELEEMVDKLGVILPEGKLKKNDIYQSIYKHIELAWV